MKILFLHSLTILLAFASFSNQVLLKNTVNSSNKLKGATDKMTYENVNSLTSLISVKSKIFYKNKFLFE